ncbi:MAG TPA: BamA/TamA family outer membrane protein [Candidatus Eisenbacteria bacterium]|nr:BamA/TamA family outer membrane protein [Candidatus Eisenbacteria bacterium]
MKTTLIFMTLMLVSIASSARATPRLEYRGGGLSRNQAEALFAPALRAPGDSAALATALRKLVSGLQAAGYLDARAHARWDSAAAGPRLEVDTESGDRHRITSLAIDTPSAAESLVFASALKIGIGDWASTTALDDALSEAVRHAAAKGHPYAQLVVSQLEWDRLGARVRLGGSLGPRVTVSEVRFEGMKVTGAGLATRAVGPLAGRAFDPASAEAGRERLMRLGLFRSVVYDGLEGESDWTKARLVYRVEEPAYNRFEGAVASQGEGRLAGLLRVDLGNLAGSGRSLAATWQSRGEPGEALSARYVEPLLLGAPLRFEAMLEHQREDSLFLRARWSTRLSFLLPGRERLEAGYEQDHVIDQTASDTEVDAQSTLFGLERDGRDAPLIARRGTRLRIGASQTFKKEDLGNGTRKTTLSSADGLADMNVPLTRHMGMAWELSGAGRFGSERVLGVYERYPLGGASTLRGFDEQAFRVDRFVLSRLEWRWFAGPGGQHLAGFWDHVWTFTRLPDSTGSHAETVSHDAVGIGMRVVSPAGLVGVDYGLEPGRPPVEGKLHVRLVTQF